MSSVRGRYKMLRSTKEGWLTQSEARGFQKKKASKLSINEEKNLARRMRSGDNHGIGNRNSKSRG